MPGDSPNEQDIRAMGEYGAAVSPVGAYLVETFVALLGVLALAVVILYGARRFGLARPRGPLELLGRLPLDGRRSVYLVKVGKLVYVLGASEGGLVRLGEIGAADLQSQPDSKPEETKPSAPRRTGAEETFSQVLARVARFGAGSGQRAEEESVDKHG